MTKDVSINTAKRAFELLETLERLNGATFTEVRNVMDMPKSSAHEYLQTLLDLEYVVEDDGTYYVSTKCLEIGEKRRAKMKLYQASKDEMEALAAETGEMVGLMIEEHGVGVHLELATGERAPDLNLVPGQRFSLHETAPGRAILANLPANRIETILEREQRTEPDSTERSRRWSSNEISLEGNLEELRTELEEIRERGYASNPPQRIEGVHAIAAPIICGGSVLGAISIGGPVQRLTEERLEEDLRPRILEVANLIEVNYLHS